MMSVKYIYKVNGLPSLQYLPPIFEKHGESYRVARYDLLEDIAFIKEHLPFDPNYWEEAKYHPIICNSFNIHNMYYFCGPIRIKIEENDYEDGDCYIASPIRLEELFDYYQGAKLIYPK